MKIEIIDMEKSWVTARITTGFWFLKKTRSVTYVKRSLGRWYKYEETGPNVGKLLLVSDHEIQAMLKAVYESGRSII